MFAFLLVCAPVHSGDKISDPAMTNFLARCYLHLGAKAVVHLDGFFDLPLVLFWRTGLSQEGVEFHHRDAIAVMERDGVTVSNVISE